MKALEALADKVKTEHKIEYDSNGIKQNDRENFYYFVWR